MNDTELRKYLEKLAKTRGIPFQFDRFQSDAVVSGGLKLNLDIIEVDRGRRTGYSGNFSAYQAKKAEVLEAEAVQNRKFDRLLAQEEVWIRKGIEARRTRNEGRGSVSGLSRRCGLCRSSRSSQWA